MATSIRKQADMDADKVKFRGEGFRFTAASNTTTADTLKITEARLIDGCELITNGAVFGDRVAISVVDVDNVLGYGYNTTLDTFCSNWYINPNTQTSGRVVLPYSAEIIAGLYMKVSFTTTSSNSVDVACNFFAHKYLA